MSGDSLSQEDIDALVNGVAGGEPAAAPEPAAETDAEPPVETDSEAVDEAGTADEPAADAEVVEEPVDEPVAEAEVADEPVAEVGEADAGLSAIERDTVGEVGNICMSSAATALSGLLGRPVQITTPEVDVVDEAEVRRQFAGPAVVVLIEYTEGLDGRNLFILTTRDASVVADLMMGGEGTPSDEIDELHASAVGEAMNQMMGSSATAMAEMVGRRVDISAPKVEIIDLSDDPEARDLGFDGPIVRTSFRLNVGDLIDTTLMQLMPIDFARSLVDSLTTVPEPAAPAPAEDDRHLHSVPVPVAQPVTFPSLDEVPSIPGGSDISLLLDVPLQVTVELGRTQLRIRNVLELVPGSIIELDKLAGEPVDVLVNGKQIARGEVVVIDEEFGVRITDVASQAKRLRGLAAEGS